MRIEVIFQCSQSNKIVEKGTKNRATGELSRDVVPVSQKSYIVVNKVTSIDCTKLSQVLGL